MNVHTRGTIPVAPCVQPCEPAHSDRKHRVAVVISHPIQYFAPLFKWISAKPRIDLTVFYCSLQGARVAEDPEFGISFAWDIPLLEGYKWKLLKNYWKGRLGRFFSCINPSIIRELKAGAYDAVIVFGWGSATAWMTFVGAHLSRTPWILYGDSVSLHDSENGWVKMRVKRAILCPLFRKTAAFLVVGTFNSMFYESYGAQRHKFFRMPYPVDNDFFIGAAERARQYRKSIRARHGIPPDVVLILFVGKLIPRKRPQDVLAVLQRLQRTMPYLGAAFIGEGELRTSLDNEIMKHRLKNAFLLGFKNQTEMPEAYIMSDIFVLPSNREHWGLVANEAMACGLPVVVSDRTGVSGDNVKHGENGFIYPAGDIAALEEIIHTLAINPELRNQMGQKSLEIIRTYGYEQCVEGIAKALGHLRASD